MPNNETWMAKVEALAPKEQETLLGTSLSRRFARLPLWLSHPANIGGFYGLLIALALLLPYAFGDQNNEVWGVQWIYHTSLLLVACGASGFLSLVMISLSKRPPMAPPRQFLYPMPFIGLALLSIDRVGMMDMPAMLFIGAISPEWCWSSCAKTRLLHHRKQCILELGQAFIVIDPAQGNPIQSCG